MARAPTNRKRVAVDIGGTFTDVCVLDEQSGRIDVAKVPFTADPIDAAIEGCDRAGIDLRDVIEIGRSTKEDLWDAYRDNPPP